MQLELFINFDGNCREAVEFYAKVFKSTVNDLLTYGDAPLDPSFMPESDRDRIMYAGIPVGGITLMFMDVPFGTPITAGDNINPAISIAEADEVTRIFDELKEDGEVYAELEKTFYSELYGMVKDKFGIIWHILQSAPPQQ